MLKIILFSSVKTKEIKLLKKKKNVHNEFV